MCSSDLDEDISAVGRPPFGKHIDQPERGEVGIDQVHNKQEKGYG